MFERQHLTWGAGEDVAFWVTKKNKGAKDGAEMEPQSWAGTGTAATGRHRTQKQNEKSHADITISARTFLPEMLKRNHVLDIDTKRCGAAAEQCLSLLCPSFHPTARQAAGPQGQRNCPSSGGSTDRGVAEGKYPTEEQLEVQVKKPQPRTKVAPQTKVLLPVSSCS